MAILQSQDTPIDLWLAASSLAGMVTAARYVLIAQDDQMTIKRWLLRIQVRPWIFASLFSTFIALFLALSYFEILPIHLNSTVLTEPVLFREGYLPFNNVADQKPPLLKYFIAATLPIFNGDAVLALRVLHCLLVFIIVILSLLWVYRVKGGWALIASGVFFLAWSAFFGYWAVLYFDIALTPFYALALFFVTKAEDHQSFWTVLPFGLITGVAILIKQQAAIFCVLMAISLIWLGIYRKVPFTKLFKLAIGYLIGLCLPIALFIFIYIYAGGKLDELIYWTITVNFNGIYARTAKVLPSWTALRNFLLSLLLLPVFIWGLFSKPKNGTLTQSYRFWLFIVFLSTLILIYPRWSGRHLAAALPFLAVISGIACADLIHIPLNKARHSAGFILYIAIIVWWGSIAFRTYSSSISQSGSIYFATYSNFIDLAENIRSAIPAEGKVAVLPIDDETMNLYYFLNRLPPRFIFYNVPWFMEGHAIQRWLDTMDQDQPVAAIYFKGRLGLENYAPSLVDYLYRHYKVVKEVIWEGVPVLIMTRSP